MVEVDPDQSDIAAMRICFLNHDLQETTGAGRFGRNLLAYLRAADPTLRATVLTSVPSGHPLELALIPGSPLGLVSALPRIRRIFRPSDIIHALDGWPYGALAAVGSLGLGRKLVITAIGSGAVKPLWQWQGGLLASAYRRADRVVAISSYTKREILRKVPDLQIEVINHAVEESEFAGDLWAELTPPERATIRSLRPYVLSVGGWKRRKGFEYSFPAFAEMRVRFPNLGYVICGIGPKPQLSQPLGITGAVSYFKGVRWPFLKALYANAELFLLLPQDDAKDIEGFGFAFLEAAAAGLPVIGTHESGAEDAVADGENGFLVPQRDSHQAASRAIEILSSRELRARLALASRLLAQRMSWSRVIDRYQEMYRELSRALHPNADSLL